MLTRSTNSVVTAVSAAPPTDSELSSLRADVERLAAEYLRDWFCLIPSWPQRRVLQLTQGWKPASFHSGAGA